MHVGEAELAALVGVGQALVIKAEAVEDRRLEVVRVNRILDDMEAEVVRRAVGEARFDAATNPASSRFLKLFKACDAHLNVPHDAS